MSRIHVYITPYADDLGVDYGDEVEVTRDVQSDGLGAISQSLDNTDYDIGIFRNDNFSLRLMNDEGLYSQAGTTESIFKYKRGGSFCRVTWEPGNGPLVCGFFKANGLVGSMISEEITLFRGIIKDDASASDIDDQLVNFTVLGYESLFESLTVGAAGEQPFDSISPGDSLSSVILKLADQDPFNGLVLVDGGNITLGVDVTLDDKTDLENKTVSEAFADILLATNSVMYIRDSTFYVSPREAHANLSYTFYGQGSNQGVENIIAIDSYRTGENRIFNFLTWKDSSERATDAGSIDKYKISKKELDLPIITDPGKRTTLLASIAEEFGQPKREFDLETPITPDRLDLFLLDRVSVDYPSLALLPGAGKNVAIYGVGEYDRDYYAESVFALTIESSARFKIMARKINFKNETLVFRMREL